MAYHVVNSKVRLPQFRVHIVLLNDPGRLLSVHIMHTRFVAGWAGLMVLYELIVFDPTDPVYNPIWRQSSYILPFITRLGVVSSIYHWELGLKLFINSYWAYETIRLAHIILSGTSILVSFWHWAY